jgi:hypothetical protein
MPLKVSPDKIGFNALGDGPFQLPFPEQIDYFRQKTNLSTEHYDDIIRDAHDRAFVVAGATKADLLIDLRKAVDNAIAEGKSIGWFRREFDSIVAKHGWHGWTGEDTQAGRDWRTRVIYRTNMASSYAAGRWAQLNDPNLLKSRPYWKYVHNDTVLYPRELHLAWNGLVLKHDDPWWRTRFPPNGWGCRCRVTAVRADQYKGERAPDNGTYEHVDRNGEVHVLPQGVDYGWDYAPGANLRDTALNKADAIGGTIGSALRQELARSGDDKASRIDWLARSVVTLDHIAGILKDIAAIKPEWLPYGVDKVVASNLDGIFAATDSRGYFVLSTAEIPAAGGRSGFELTLSAFNKVKNKTPLSFDEEYALESIWHEIGHNRQAHQMLDSMPNEQRIIAEALHQTLARQSYPEFLSVLGGSPSHLQAIRKGGRSYRKSAGSLTALLIALGWMDQQTLTIALDVLRELHRIDRAGNWDKMAREIAAALATERVRAEEILAILNDIGDGNWYGIFD